ncbi:YkgJ family cysteine cluster protein [Rubripirellula sp.]|nr:YkgJ family cysteine cluster protein [Rubripirellula sp.]MDB4645213.1 YkgJ family cysteine cluster protein [Rubripirellula sp.]
MNPLTRPDSTLPTISDCDSCGICCLHMGYPSYVTGASFRSSTTGAPSGERAWLEMPETLKQELLNYIHNYTSPVDGGLDGPCVWYDAETRRCKNHEHRPEVCRNFAVGGKGCLEWRRHYRKQHPEYLPSA